MNKSVITRSLVILAAGVATLAAFRSPPATPVPQSTQQLDQQVIGTAIRSMYTGQAALRGIVVAQTTVPALVDSQLYDRDSRLLKTQFPQHVQIVPLTAASFEKEKKPMKLQKQLLDVPQIKMDFESIESLNKMGLEPSDMTDSSWRILKAKYPNATNFASFSLPGYDAEYNVALVSYFNLCGPGCYHKGYILLERNLSTRVWRMVHRNIVYGGG